MNYLISKKKGDARITTCGVIIPDGFFVVMGLSFDNERQLKHVRGFGYNVTPTDLPEGHYAPDGRRVDKWSIRRWAYENGQLEYLDEAPIDGAVPPAPDRSHIRPPDVSLRPDPVSLEEVGDENVDLPPAVAAARALLAAQGQRTVSVEGRKASGHAEGNIPTESDAETVAKATGAPVDELTLLRAACDAQGIEWHPRNSIATLKSKLETAAA
jgi:hypothetical protein